MAKQYSELLKDPRWQRKRLEVLQAADFTCESCGAKEKTLHVHHKKYVQGRKPWEYTREELSCECETCHEKRHKLTEQITSSLALASLDEVEERAAQFTHPCDYIAFTPGASYGLVCPDCGEPLLTHTCIEVWQRTKEDAPNGLHCLIGDDASSTMDTDMQHNPSPHGSAIEITFKCGCRELGTERGLAIYQRKGKTLFEWRA